MPDIHPPSPAVTELLSERRAEIDAAIDRWLPRPPDCPPPLAEAMRYAVGSGGKRFRPLLALGAAEAVAAANGPSASRRAEAVRLALPVACAVEFVHTHSLVHDDLPAMDDDVLRRGQPTVHVRYGEALAILVGDGFLAEAFALLAREPADDGDAALLGRKLHVATALGQAIGASGMVGGQAVDLGAAIPAGASGQRPALDLAGLSEMHARKTGSLIRAGAIGGALMAGATRGQVEAIARFAEGVGLAFQIVDDVMDAEGCTATLGKTAGKDAAAGKATFCSLLGGERARRMALDVVAEAQQVLTDAGLSTAVLTTLAANVVRGGTVRRG